MCISNRCCWDNCNGYQNATLYNHNNGCNQSNFNINRCENLGYYNQCNSCLGNIDTRGNNQCNRNNHPIVVGTFNACCNMCCRNNMLYNPYTNVLFINCNCGYNSCSRNCNF